MVTSDDINILLDEKGSAGKVDKSKEELAMQAKQALENPALIIAFEDLKANALYKFQISDARDKEGREGLYWFLKALEEFRGQLNIYLSEDIVKKSKEQTEAEKFQERFDLA